MLLLLLTKSNIPISIVSYLSGLKATTWSFNFIPFRNIPGIEKIVSGIDFKLPDRELEYFGINSGSTFANNFSMIWIVLIFGVIHCLFMLIYKLIKRKVKSKKWAKCMKGTYQFFVFSLYIRIIFEANVFLLISSFSELNEWNTSSSANIVSICFAFIGGWICLCFVSLSLINYSMHKNTKNMEEYIPLKEFFSGVLDSRKSRLYQSLLLLRRVIFVAWIVFAGSYINFPLVYPMIVNQKFLVV